MHESISKLPEFIFIHFDTPFHTRKDHFPLRIHTWLILRDIVLLVKSEGLNLWPLFATDSKSILKIKKTNIIFYLFSLSSEETVKIGIFITKNVKKKGQNNKFLEIRKKLLTSNNKVWYSIKVLFKKGVKISVPELKSFSVLSFPKT